MMTQTWSGLLSRKQLRRYVRPGKRWLDRAQAGATAVARGKPSTVVLDTGVCNLDSMMRALVHCGANATIAQRPDDFQFASRIILPGVGTFRAAMVGMERLRYIDPIRQAAKSGVPILGVCVGMQILASRGMEGGNYEGLDLIPGIVKPLLPRKDERIPHVGWNEVVPAGDCPLLAGLVPSTDFYFVHSFHFVPADPVFTVATTPHGGGFVSVVQRGNIFGTQCHLEKSQQAGFTVLRNFLALDL